MKLSRTWIDQHLSAAEVEQLVDDLMQLAATPTGEQIRELVLEMKGEAPSVQSCLNWRAASYVPRYLASRRALAETLAEAAGDGKDLGEVNRSRLQQLVFDTLLREDETNPLDLEKLNLISLITARLRLGDQRESLLHQRTREMEERIERLARENAEAAKKAAAVAREMVTAAKEGGLSEETVREMEERLKLL